MNRLERAVGDVDPGLSVRLRALKLRFRHDIARGLIQDMIGPGEVCVDVGANRGVYTHIMSVQVGSEGHVHAVKPFPASYERLHTLARRRGNVIVHTLALSDHPGSALLPFPVHDGHPIDALASLERNGTQIRTAVWSRCLRSMSYWKASAGCRSSSAMSRATNSGSSTARPASSAGVAPLSLPRWSSGTARTRSRTPLRSSPAPGTAAGSSPGAGCAPGGVRHRPSPARLPRRPVHPYAMPDGYVYDFLLCPPGTMPPRWSLGRHERRDGRAG